MFSSLSCFLGICTLMARFPTATLIWLLTLEGLMLCAANQFFCFSPVAVVVRVWLLRVQTALHRLQLLITSTFCFYSAVSVPLGLRDTVHVLIPLILNRSIVITTHYLQ
jgi:hypothetical protein